MVRINGHVTPLTKAESPFKQVIVVKPDGSLDHVLDGIRARIDEDVRVKEIEPFYWEDGGWAIHLSTRRKVKVSDIHGVKRSFTMK